MPLTNDDLAVAYAQYAPQIRAFCFKHLRDEDAADDALSQTFTVAVQKREQWEDRGEPVSAWLTGIAKHCIQDQHRRANRAGPSLDAEGAPQVADTRDEMAALVEGLGGQQELTGLLEVLPVNERRVLERRVVHGKTSAATAADLGIDKRTVRRLKKQALGRIRAQVQTLHQMPLALRQRLLPARTAPARRRPEGRAWSDEEKAILRECVARGDSIRQIARRLGRSPNAVKVKLHRFDCRRREQVTVLTARGVATVLGVKCSKTVARWIEEGSLGATNGGTPERPIWRVTWDALLDFLRRRNRWMAWAPERITDESLRIWAAQLRAGQPRWLTPGEVAERYHVAPTVPNSWIAKGELPATRYGNWWIWEEHLAGWTPPGERPRQRWDGTCLELGCDAPILQRGLCAAHITRARRAGAVDEALPRLQYHARKEWQDAAFGQARKVAPEDAGLRGWGNVWDVQPIGHVLEVLMRRSPVNARETILTLAALAPFPVPATAFDQFAGGSTSVANHLFRMAEAHELRRVRPGVYTLGPQAPLWAQLLKRHARGKPLQLQEVEDDA